MKSKEDNPLTKASLMYLQAERYYKGAFGTPKDHAEAVKWYARAAAHGLEEAIVKLAYLNLMGDGVEENESFAYALYMRAAKMGNAEAMYHVACLTENVSERIKWFKRSAKKGYGPAQIKLGIMFQDGDEIKEDDAEAFKWFKIAAESGEMDAQYFLGCCYADGKGTKKDVRKAVECWRRGAEMGEVFCISTLNLYEIPY